MIASVSCTRWAMRARSSFVNLGIGASGGGGLGCTYALAGIGATSAGGVGLRRNSRNKRCPFGGGEPRLKMADRLLKCSKVRFSGDGGRPSPTAVRSYPVTGRRARFDPFPDFLRSVAHKPATDADGRRDGTLAVGFGHD
jgi:hypothetical protein